MKTAIEADSIARRARNGKETGRHPVHQQSTRTRRAPEPNALLPLTEPVFHILLALVDQELHGYGIILSVEQATHGAVRLRTGTLYTAIRRMVDDGLIEESERGPNKPDERRRYYRLTSFGRAVARVEARRVADLAALSRTKGLLARGRRH